MPERKRGRWRWVMLAVLVVIGAVLGNVFRQIDDWDRDLNQNFAVLEADSQDPELRPLLLSATPAEVAGRLHSWVDQTSGWATESREETENEIKMHLTHTTRFLRFTDDVHVRLIADGDQTRVEAESRSRVGKGDLGQNPRNLRELTRALQSP